MNLIEKIYLFICPKFKNLFKFSKIKKISCPSEIYNCGMCLERNNTRHCNCFNHYTRYNKNGSLYEFKDNKVCCKYLLFNCKEINNSKHRMVFYHTVF